MDFTELRLTADAAMSECLTDAGFRRTAAGKWNRHRGVELNVIQLQKHSSKDSFCVNLGVHYTFLPKAGTEAPLCGDEIELPDCELKLRLTEHAKVNDQWWTIAASSVNQVANLMDRRGLKIFDSYQIEGPINGIDGKNIEHEHTGLLDSMTKVRACLFLARMHEHLGNRAKCVEAARMGITYAGMAVGPKIALKDILGRMEQLG